MYKTGAKFALCMHADGWLQQVEAKPFPPSMLLPALAQSWV